MTSQVGQGALEQCRLAHHPFRPSPTLRPAGDESELVAHDSVFSGGRASEGGCLHLKGPVNAEFKRSRFERCVTPNGWGGTFLADGGAPALLFEDCTIRNTESETSDAGTGLVKSGTTTLRRTAVSNSRARSNAGCFRVDSGKLTLEDSSLEASPRVRFKRNLSQ